MTNRELVELRAKLCRQLLLEFRGKKYLKQKKFHKLFKEYALLEYGNKVKKMSFDQINDKYPTDLLFHYVLYVYKESRVVEVSIKNKICPEMMLSILNLRYNKYQFPRDDYSIC